MIMPRCAFGMGRLGPTQLGGVLVFSGLGKFVLNRAGYAVITWSKRVVRILP